MDRAAVIARLKEHEAELKRLGIEHLYLFGSTARGEAGEDSDVDLFLDHPVGSLGLFELMDVKDAAARILGRSLDTLPQSRMQAAWPASAMFCGIRSLSPMTCFGAWCRMTFRNWEKICREELATELDRERQKS